VENREARTAGPTALGDILAEALRVRGDGPPVDADNDREDGITGVVEVRGTVVPHRGADGDDPDWLLHETQLLRQPVYRTERADAEDDPPASYFDNPAADQLPLLTYEYDPQTTVISRIGELGTRDMLVMAVLSQAFFANGCPADNKVHGDHATLGYIARQLGMHPEGATRLIRSSIERLSTARVKVKVHDVDKRAVGGTATTRGEVTVGFLANFGSRERKQKGVAVKRDNYIQLDQAMADLIRAGEFTFLRAEALRALRRQPLALKLYAWARTHRPDERGRIFYGVSRLAKQLGCSDQNSTRRRRKMVEAVEAVCGVAGDEFPGYELRVGRTDQTLVLRKARNRGPAELRRIAAAD
jgi:hypothetical protein